jgi:beta-lactamase class A
MGKLKDQLAGIAALIAAVVAIGGGFATYGKLTEKISVLESKSTTDYSAQIAVMEEKITALEAGNNGDVDTALTTLDKRSAINEKQIQLLQVQIEELKESSSNPLAN